MQKILDGGWPGGPAPYGYRCKDKQLVLVDEEAVVVKKIYELYLQDNLKLYAGSSANPTTEIAIASSDETGSVYDLSAGDYSYIKIENPSEYAVYMKSIDIYLAE